MRPWATVHNERAQIESAAASIAGHSVDRVSYLLPVTSDLTTRRHYGTFDQVDMGIELTNTSGWRCQLRWMMDDVQEGLSVAEVPPDVDNAAPVGLLDVSAEQEWAALLRRPITHVGLSWHRPADDALDAVWSVRLGFDSDEIVIALGEATDDRKGIRYMPDSVVVIFDEITARGYQPLSSLGSSWGGLIT